MTAIGPTKLARELFGSATPPPRDDKQVADVIRAAELRRAGLIARDNLIGFTKLTMPSIEDMDNVNLSQFEDARHHHLIARKLEDVEAGRCPRLIITMPPRHGKTELASRRFPAWYMGRNPRRQVIFSTYNQTFAEDGGGKVREIMRMPQYRLAFPNVELRSDSQSREKLETSAGGVLFFAGAGGALTGRGADLLVIDDPLKGREEAESETIRRQIWDWYTSVAYTRLMPGGAIIIILTRWHEDDIVGRILASPEIRDEYELLSLPAIAEDDDPMGRRPGEALWPEWYPANKLEITRKTLSAQGSARDWASLYQQRPTPDDGDFFTREMFKPYSRDELPDDFRGIFRIYGASDHAVAQKQKNDKSVIGCVGFDRHGDIWILPDVRWDRLDGEAQVDEMISQMLRHRPVTWWAEKGHITQSLGPYLRRQMFERKVPTWLQEKTPSADKQKRAQAIRARAALRPIRVPAYMSWWEKAEAELLAFPNGRHDDFVDWLAWIGLGLETEFAAATPQERVRDDEPTVGSGAWVVWRSRKDRQKEADANRRRGW